MTYLGTSKSFARYIIDYLENDNPQRVIDFIDISFPKGFPADANNHMLILRYLACKYDHIDLYFRAIPYGTAGSAQAAQELMADIVDRQKYKWFSQAMQEFGHPRLPDKVIAEILRDLEGPNTQTNSVIYSVIKGLSSPTDLICPQLNATLGYKPSIIQYMVSDIHKRLIEAAFARMQDQVYNRDQLIMLMVSRLITGVFVVRQQARAAMQPATQRMLRYFQIMTSLPTDMQLEVSKRS